ncbi:PAS domain-containing protein [Pseudofrankia sp. DC12]|uniref:PAS domain-containing protein n=1 Tax=Pseudofrankia sp. DC12 TaxID=683315 RepID=UPI001E3657E0|nr:PAS domain-containing protein [Pseudofrankia sp. DC12]
MTGLVADAVSAGLLLVNTEGRVVWVNAALAGVVGLAPAGREPTAPDGETAGPAPEHDQGAAVPDPRTQFGADDAGSAPAAAATGPHPPAAQTGPDRAAAEPVAGVAAAETTSLDLATSDPGAQPATGLSVAAQDTGERADPAGADASAGRTGADDGFAERLGSPLPEPSRALARRAVAEARLPLSGLVVGAAPVDVAWTGPDGVERRLRLRCQRLTPPGYGWADGLMLYEVFDVTDAYQAVASAPAGWTAPTGGDQAWRGTPEWDQAAWGTPVTDDTVMMARPVVPRPPVLPPGEAEAAPAADAGAGQQVVLNPSTGGAALLLLSSPDRLDRIEELTRTGTWEWDLSAGSVSFSRNQIALLGFRDGDEMDLGQVEQLVPPVDMSMIRSAVAAAIRTPGTFTYLHRLRERRGQGERVFECFGEVITDDAGRPARVLGTSRDITDLHRVQQELAHLAERDALTGLYNRRAINKALRTHLSTTPDGRPGSLLIIDVDHFKDINDLRGHAVGDIVMRGLSQVLREELPAAELGRLGGDEFAVLLPDGDGEAGLAVAESVCQAVARALIPVDELALRVTVSIGVVPLAHVDSETTALAQADLALYDSKDAGRDRARLFTDAQYSQAERRVSVTQRVRSALESGTLAVDALPLVDLAARRVIGYELLVRLRDGLTPELSPREFLEPVERTELVLRLDRWVVGQAVSALAADGPHGSLYLHVNVSARSVEDPGFGDFVLDALRGSAVNPTRLGLEIAERSTLVNVEPARRLAEKLTAAGCRFILDDFGVGMGSVVHLRTLPFSGVKIDGDFVRQADANAQDMALVDAVVRIARTLGMYTIAENVDRESLARVLADIGVDYAQGFHIGPPRPLTELLAERLLADEAASGLGRAGWDQAELDRAAQEHAGSARTELDRADYERAELERAEYERADLERSGLERAERERAELERAELESAEYERAEYERAELERAELERAERERVERERAELERAEYERAEYERAERERAELERAERERAELMRIERERVELERERAERAWAARERAEADRAERERLERERAELERIDRDRVERDRARRDRIEAERRRAEHRGSVSWENPGFDGLVPGGAAGPPAMPPGRSASSSGWEQLGPGRSGPPTDPSGGLNRRRPADGSGPAGWTDGPATVPPAYPSMSPPPRPSVPPSDQVPDYPPTGGLAVGGPPSGGMRLPDVDLAGGGYGAGGYGGFAPNGYRGGPRGDGYEGGGYGGYDASRRDPLGLDRVGQAGRDPLFGPRGLVPEGDQAGPPPAAPAGRWDTPGAAGPAPWDIVSVGGVVAAGPGPGPGPGQDRVGDGGPNGPRNGLDIGGIVGLGGFGAAAASADDADDAETSGGSARLGGDPARGPVVGNGSDWPGQRDGYAGSAGRRWTGPQPQPRDGWSPGDGDGAQEPRLLDEGRPGGRGAHRPPEARGDGGRPARRGGSLPWSRRAPGDARAAASARAEAAGAGDAATPGRPAGAGGDEDETQVAGGEPTDGAPAPRPAARDAAETQVVTLNNGEASGPSNGLYRWP